MLQFTRAVGSSMARIADAALSMFLVNVEGPIVQDGRRRRAARGGVGGGGRRCSTWSRRSWPGSSGSTCRPRSAASGSRTGRRRTRRCSGSRSGSSTWSGSRRTPSRPGPTSSPSCVETFEGRANDIVAQHGGRVVKHIGDEVMFVDADAADRLRHRAAPGRELRRGRRRRTARRASDSDRGRRGVATTTARWSTSRRASPTSRSRVRCSSPNAVQSVRRSSTGRSRSTPPGGAC